MKKFYNNPILRVMYMNLGEDIITTSSSVFETKGIYSDENLWNSLENE